MLLARQAALAAPPPEHTMRALAGPTPQPAACPRHKHALRKHTPARRGTRSARAAQIKESLTRTNCYFAGRKTDKTAESAVKRRREVAALYFQSGLNFVPIEFPRVECGRHRRQRRQWRGRPGHPSSYRLDSGFAGSRGLTATPRPAKQQQQEEEGGDPRGLRPEPRGPPRGHPRGRGPTRPAARLARRDRSLSAGRLALPGKPKPLRPPALDISERLSADQAAGLLAQGVALGGAGGAGGALTR